MISKTITQQIMLVWALWIEKPKQKCQIRRTTSGPEKTQAKRWLCGHLWSTPERLTLSRVDMSEAAHVLSRQRS